MKPYCFSANPCALNYRVDTISALEARTEGWAAGLQLAALALQNLPNSHAFIQTFHGTHRYILDYLAEEVLRQQAEEIRNFLFQTAVLEKFNAPLCNAITGRSDSQAVLAHLEQANLFIIPLDNERIWYRYHHLFADYLRTGLTKPEQALLQAKASHWYEANDLVFEAVKYAFLSENFELAADVIERVIQKVSAWSSGEMATWVGWLDSLATFRCCNPDRRYACTLPEFGIFRGALYWLRNTWIRPNNRCAKCPTTDPNTEKLLAISALYRGSLAGNYGDIPDRY